MSHAPDHARAKSTVAQRLRRFFRFNLRSALLLVAIACAFLAWASRDVHIAYRRSQLITEVDRLGGRIDVNPTEPAGYSALNWFGSFWDARLARKIDGISLDKPHVTDEDVARLVPIVRSLPEIRWIRLAQSSITDRSIQPLASCTQLRHIDLSETAITAAGVEPISQLTDLEGLSLLGTTVTDDAVLHLTALSNLTDVNLSRTKVTDRSLDAARSWPKLQEIRLHGTHVTDAGVLALQRRLPRLRVWVIAGNSVPSYDELAKATTLNLRDPFFTDSYLECLADFPQIHALHLDGSRVTAVGLRQVPHGEKIRVLWLDYTAVDDRALAAISKWPNLQELMLRNTSITDAGLAHLAELPRLSTLWLTGSCITDGGLVHVGRLRELEFLDLDATGIDGYGLRHLAGLTKLRRLMLDATAVTDDSLRNLPPLAALECLDLELTEISDRGVEHLKTLPKLCIVPSRNSKITASALEFFAARRPPGQDDSSVQPRDPTSNSPPMQ